MTGDSMSSPWCLEMSVLFHALPTSHRAQYTNQPTSQEFIMLAGMFKISPEFHTTSGRLFLFRSCRQRGYIFWQILHIFFVAAEGWLRDEGAGRSPAWGAAGSALLCSRPLSLITPGKVLGSGCDFCAGLKLHSARFPLEM